jgi:hypothetical protein
LRPSCATAESSATGSADGPFAGKTVSATANGIANIAQDNTASRIDRPRNAVGSICKTRFIGKPGTDQGQRNDKIGTDGFLHPSRSRSLEAFGCYLLPVLAFSTSFGFGAWVKLNMLLIGLAIVSYEP